jgi:hypothetical protein
MVPAEHLWTTDDAQRARDRHNQRHQRLYQDAPVSDPRPDTPNNTPLADQRSATPMHPSAAPDCHDDALDVKRTMIELALARARARRTPTDPKNST